MTLIYNIENAKIAYTYEEWLSICKQRENENLRRIKQRTEYLYFLKQRLSGIVIIASGITLSFLVNGDVTFLIFVLPLGIFLITTKEKVMTFYK